MLTVLFRDKIKLMSPETGVFLQFSLLQFTTWPLCCLLYTSSVVIMEAKNVVHEDFHVRQLYYPYRLWRSRVKKPIRLVFSVYSNMIYRLFEYRFATPEDYSSIEPVQAKNYSLQDTKISKMCIRDRGRCVGIP